MTMSSRCWSTQRSRVSTYLFIGAGRPLRVAHDVPLGSYPSSLRDAVRRVVVAERYGLGALRAETGKR